MTSFSISGLVNFCFDNILLVSRKPLMQKTSQTRIVQSKVFPRQVEKQHRGGSEDTEAGHNVNTSFSSRGSYHEKISARSIGGVICSLQQGGACLHCDRVYEQGQSSRASEEYGWETIAVWRSYIHCSTGL